MSEMNVHELALKTCLLAMSGAECHKLPLDPAGYRRAALEASQLVQDHFLHVVHHAHAAASEGFQTLCENAYFAQHGEFSCAQTPQNHAIRRACNETLARWRTDPPVDTAA